MDQYAIKSVAFGGFDKEDVVRYIEEAARKAASVQKELQEEVEDLKKQLAALQEEATDLRGQAGELSVARDALQQELEQEKSRRVALEPLEEEVKSLRQEVASLRPDAQAYEHLRERVGNIECDARKRAAEIEERTVEQMSRTLERFRTQYTSLMATFTSTANYVNGELRKVEVNLSQLPRAMDPSSGEMEELAALLSRMGKKEES